MRSKINLKKSFKVSLIALLTVLATISLSAHEKNSNLKNFKIIVEKTKNGIKLQGCNGTAWLNLSFAINNDKAQEINNLGMDEVSISSKEDSSVSDFRFTITKTEKGFKLKGIEGTAWKELSFSLSEKDKQAINELGMTDLN